MAWTQIVTWLIVVLGWCYVNHQNNLREKRKEIRALIDGVQTQLNDIEKLAIEYHTNDEASENLAFELKRNLNRKLLINFQILESRGFKTGECNTYRKQLRKAITLRNFDTGSFELQIVSSEIIKDIWLTKDKLSHEIERCFSQEYK